MDTGQMEIPEDYEDSTKIASQYCLRWKYHQRNLQCIFAQLLEKQSFCDVTLACDGKTLGAHKIILSASSDYFESIFRSCNEKDPIVILKDIHFEDLKMLVDFIYKGEIIIETERVKQLLAVAKCLMVKGLAAATWKHGDNNVRRFADDMDNTENESNLTDDQSDSNVCEAVANSQIIAPLIENPLPHILTCSGKNNTVLNMDITNGTSDMLPSTSADIQTPSDPAGSTTRKRKCRLRSNMLKLKVPRAADEVWENLKSSEKCDNSEDNNSEEFMGETHSLENIQDVITEPDIIVPSCNSPIDRKNLHPDLLEVIQLTSYMQQGGKRPQFWEINSTKRVLEAIKRRDIEMKVGAELLGVSYGTLYGRYRDTHGCLKHPYRVREFWHEPSSVDVISKLQRKELSLFKAAETLNVTVTTLANYLATLGKDGTGRPWSSELDDEDSMERPDISRVKQEVGETEDLIMNDKILSVKKEPLELPPEISFNMPPEVPLSPADPRAAPTPLFIITSLTSLPPEKLNKLTE